MNKLSNLNDAIKLIDQAASELRSYNREASALESLVVLESIRKAVELSDEISRLSAAVQQGGMI